MGFTVKRWVVFVVAASAIVAAGSAAAGKKGDTGRTKASAEATDRDAACELARSLADADRPIHTRVTSSPCACREGQFVWKCEATLEWVQYMDDDN